MNKVDHHDGTVRSVNKAATCACSWHICGRSTGAGARAPHSHTRTHTHTHTHTQIEREREREMGETAPPPDLPQAGRAFKPPAGPDWKHGRFKGKYVNGKTTGQMIKIMEFTGENGRVDRYACAPLTSVTSRCRNLVQNG